MSAKIRTVKRVTCVLGILFIMLGLLPVGIMTQVGSVFAQEEVPPAETEEPAPTEETAPPEEPAAPTEEPAATTEPLVVEFTPEVVMDAAASNTGPTNEDPVNDLGLPVKPPAGQSGKTKDYHQICDQYANCTKEDITGSNYPDVNDTTGSGVTFPSDATVVVIKSGQATPETFFSPNGPACDPLDCYCVEFGDGSITVKRNLESNQCQDISNIQFWKTTDVPDQDCEFHYTDCDATCGFGTQSLIIDKNPSGKGEACPVDATKTCGEAEPPIEACPTKCGYAGGDKVHIGGCEYDTCKATGPCDDGGGGGGGGGGGITAAGGGVAAVIPVTAEEMVVIPVTGVDLGFDFLALKQAFLFGGMLLFGASLLLEGASRKFRI